MFQAGGCYRLSCCQGWLDLRHFLVYAAGGPPGNGHSPRAAEGDESVADGTAVASASGSTRPRADLQAPRPASSIADARPSKLNIMRHAVLGSRGR